MNIDFLKNQLILQIAQGVPDKHMALLGLANKRFHTALKARSNFIRLVHNIIINFTTIFLAMPQEVVEKLTEKLEALVNKPRGRSTQSLSELETNLNLDQRINSYLSENNIVISNETKEKLVDLIKKFTANSEVLNTIHIEITDCLKELIRNGEFENNTSLKHICIPQGGVTSIGEWAFNGCTSLEFLTIPKGVTSIGKGAFYGCTSLESLTIPEGVTSIGESVFRGCTKLTCITIPGSVTSIGVAAFEGCTSLASVTIPGSVTSIEYEAFDCCHHDLKIFYTTKEQEEMLLASGVKAENITFSGAQSAAATGDNQAGLFPPPEKKPDGPEAQQGSDPKKRRLDHST